MRGTQSPRYLDTIHFVLEDSETTYFAGLFQHGFKIMLNSFGEFRVYRNRCPVCDRNLDNCRYCGIGSTMVYKAVNAPDLTHLSLAQALGCDRFLTMDKGYSKIVDYSDVKIEVLS